MKFTLLLAVDRNLEDYILLSEFDGGRGELDRVISHDARVPVPLRNGLCGTSFHRSFGVAFGVDPIPDAPSAWDTRLTFPEGSVDLAILVMIVDRRMREMGDR